MVLTFFHPPLARRVTTLVPPIVPSGDRRGQAGGRGDHLVVYASGAKRQVAAARHWWYGVSVYGMRGGPDKPWSTETSISASVEDGFVEARAPPGASSPVEVLFDDRSCVSRNPLLRCR